MIIPSRSGMDFGAILGSKFISKADGNETMTPSSPGRAKNACPFFGESAFFWKYPMAACGARDRARASARSRARSFELANEIYSASAS